MELRLRRFINSKRDKKVEQKLELDLTQDLPLSSTPQWLLPTTGLQSSPKAARADNHLPLSKSPNVQSVPYHSVASAKAPVFTCETVKGNGPIKMPTNRRSSVTGEIIKGPRKNQRMLEDIMEGDCVVDDRQNRDLHGRLAKNATPLATPALSTTFSSTDSNSSPRLVPQTPSSIWSVSSNDISGKSMAHVAEICLDPLGLKISPVTPVNSKNDRHLIGVSTDTDTASSSLPPPSDVLAGQEQNATITALCKAEYNHLVDLYGSAYLKSALLSPDGRERLVHAVGKAGKHHNIEAFEVALEPLPYPVADPHPSTTCMSSTNSINEIVSHEDNSDSSSPTRESRTSSCARSSSHTTNSTTDRDGAVTREEIHKMISEMRSTYLRALDSPLPGAPKPQQVVKKKRKNKPAPINTKFDAAQIRPIDRQTWHSNDYRSTHKQKRHSKLRAASTPAGGVSRLSPVQASPPPTQTRPIPRLQRADSGTLGSVVARIRIEQEVIPPSEDKNMRQESWLRDSVVVPPYLTNIISIDGTTPTITNTTPTVVNMQDTVVVPPAIKPPGNFF